MQALWHSVLSTRVPTCQKIKRVGYTSMALNTLKCNHLTPMGLKGSAVMTFILPGKPISFEGHIQHCILHCSIGRTCPMVRRDFYRSIIAITVKCTFWCNQWPTQVSVDVKPDFLQWELTVFSCNHGCWPVLLLSN